MSIFLETCPSESSPPSPPPYSGRGDPEVTTQPPPGSWRPERPARAPSRPGPPSSASRGCPSLKRPEARRSRGPRLAGRPCSPDSGQLGVQMNQSGGLCVVGHGARGEGAGEQRATSALAPRPAGRWSTSASQGAGLMGPGRPKGLSREISLSRTFRLAPEGLSFLQPPPRFLLAGRVLGEAARLASPAPLPFAGR